MATRLGVFTGIDGNRYLAVEQGDALADLSRSDLPTLAALLGLPRAEIGRRLEWALSSAGRVDRARLTAPIDRQEVWAAGVTYRRSRDARMAESTEASIYDRVYDAARPEIFLKATPHRVVGPGEAIMLRSDARWNVPEPELGVVANRHGEVVGYTIGNDLSSRDIEGENPLYLPQAKLWDRSCALGPAIVLAEGSGLDPLRLTITCAIRRGGTEVFRGATSTSEIVRPLDELIAYLFRDNAFPDGCILLTGTGIVPPDDFTLEAGDEVEITIDGLGTLRNPVGRHGQAG